MNKQIRNYKSKIEDAKDQVKNWGLESENIKYQDNLNRIPIPWDMLLSALTLAAHFGHEWGNKLWDDDRATISTLPKEGLSVYQIEELVYNPEKTYIGSPIFAPYLDDRGYLCHTSTTGRYDWEIRHEGDIFCFIHRPQGVVIDILFPSDDWLSPSVDVIRPELIERRHWEAAAYFLKAFLEPEEAERIIEKAKNGANPAF